MICLSLAVGPVATFFKKLSKYVNYRREIGLTGFFVGLLHVYISLFWLPERFPLSYFKQYWASVVVSIIALVLFAIAAYYSSIKLTNKTPYKKWIWIQRLSYIGIIFVALHMIFLNKYEKWIVWWRYFTPKLPTFAFICFVVIVVVLVLRFVVVFKRKKE